MSTITNTAGMDETRGRPESPPAPVGLLSQRAQARLLLGLRRRLLGNAAHQLLRVARTRTVLVVVFSIIFWVGLFLLFHSGFVFVNRYVPIVTGELIRTLFGLFFLSLLMMLFFSSAVIVYGGLYASDEARYLMTTPLGDDHVFVHKFVEAMLFSSWGFLLLGTPMLIAYGLTAGAGWVFYAAIVPYLIAFVGVPGGLGAIACMGVVHLFPRRKKQVLAALAVAALFGAAWIAISAFGTGSGTIMSENWLGGLLGRLRFTQAKLLPSWWISRGLLAAAAGQSSDALFLLLMLVSNGLMVCLAATWLAGRMYRASYSRLSGVGRARRRANGHCFDRIVHGAFFFVPEPVRLLVLKDLRTFRRDPAQWSQFLIFFGLLGLYFVNLRRFGYDIGQASFRHMVSFLNLTVTALILSTFTSRFVFPLLSLEGRRFWILGLLPIRRELVVWGKFVFAAAGALVPSMALVLTSDLMLRMEPAVIALHVLAVAILCVGLAGISVGLGARLPDLREQNPSKVAAGFGGTLNLIVSTLFIFAVVVLTALPCHLYYGGLESFSGGHITHEQLRWWMLGSATLSLLLGAVAVMVPLRLGIRAFRRLEM